MKYLYIKIKTVAKKMVKIIKIPGVHVWLVLWKAAQSVKAHASRHLSTLEICTSDFGILEVLLHKGELPVNTIGKKVLLTSGSITAAVDRLEGKGLVERRNHPKDRRVKVIRLTPRGRKFIENIFGDHSKAIEKTISVLSGNERKLLVKLLKKLGKNSEELAKTTFPKGA